MSIFESPAPTYATERQLGYMSSLLSARFHSPEEVPEPLQCFLPRRTMTIDEASRAIDTIKAIPTLSERQRAREQRVLARWQDWLTGDFGQEALVEKRWDSALSHHFALRSQVPGKHFTGKRLRIDRVLTPQGWSWGCGHHHSIGLEIKAGHCKTDIAQAADYANTRWKDTPDEFIIVGLYRATRNEARPLADVGCFAFIVEHHWSLGPALTLCWNGNRMWTGSVTSTGRDIPNLRWCPTRKVGSR